MLLSVVVAKEEEAEEEDGLVVVMRRCDGWDILMIALEAFQRFTIWTSHLQLFRRQGRIYLVRAQGD